MSIVESLVRARARKGLSLSEVGRRSGLQVSNLSAIEHGHREPTARTLERAASGVGIRLLAVDTHGYFTVSELAAAIAGDLSVGDQWSAARFLVQLSDDLVGAPAFTKAVLVAEVPRSISPEWDAAVAGIVEWRLGEAGLPVPDWVLDVAGVDGPWSPWPGEVLADPAQVAEPLRRRGVWMEHGELASA